MRIRLTLEINRHRDSEPHEPQFEHRDNDTLVEQIGQPHYAGFQPEQP